MMNITENIKKAISTDVLWSVSEFYHFMECIEKIGFEVDFSIDNDDLWAQISFDDKLIAYLWKKEPLIFIKADHLSLIQILIEEEFKYIQTIAVDGLNLKGLSLNMDKELMDRIRFLFDTKSFSAEDFWFYNVN